MELKEEIKKEVLKKIGEFSFNSAINNNDLLIIKNDLYDKKKETYEKAIKHNIPVKEIDVITKKFPNEPKTLHDFRQNNKRQFTREITQKIVQEIINVSVQSGVSIISDDPLFKEWINKDHIDCGITGNPMTWYLTNPLPASFIDPNGGIAIIHKGKVNDQLIYESVWISYDAYYKTDEFIIVSVRENNINKIYVSDKTDWYELNRGKTYTFEHMYNHNFGELPFVEGPGVTVFDEKTRKKYKITALDNTYELCDETLLAQTTEQSVSAKLVPILVVPGIACNHCDGSGSDIEGNKCTHCDDGIAKMPTELEHFTVRNPTQFKGEDRLSLQPYFVSPDSSIGTFHIERFQLYYNLAKQSTGIDALIDKSESGEAMKKRLEVFESLVSYIFFISFKCSFNNHLRLIYKTLITDTKKWVNFPYFKIPSKIQVKTPEVLKFNYDNSKGADKIQKALEYYESIYENNPIELKIMRIICLYYPAGVFSSDELLQLKLNGVFSNDQIAKSYWAVSLLKKMSKEIPNFMELENSILIEKLELEFPKVIKQQIGFSEISE